MRLTVIKPSYLVGTNVRFTILRRARYNIMRWVMDSNDMMLDKYLRTKYKHGLKYLCKKLLDKCTIQEDQESSSISITFIEKRYDDIATLITYGTGRMTGSKILRDIFIK